MKKINNKFLLLFSLVIALVFTSCEKQENVMYTSEKGFVQFTDESSNLFEDATAPTKISVQYGGSLASNTNGIDVKFDVSTLDTSRFAITPSNGTLTIPAGEASASIEIMPIDNITADGNLVIDITLSAENIKGIGIGGEALKNISYSLTIVDNDCPTEISAKYKAEVSAFGGFEAPSHEVELVLVDGTSNQYSVVSLWGANFVAWATGDPGYAGLFVYPAIITLNSDFTVDVEALGTYDTGGSGTYVACEDKFDLAIKTGLFGGSETMLVVLTGK